MWYTEREKLISYHLYVNTEFQILWNKELEQDKFIYK
jgi:hypothetical protein